MTHSLALRNPFLPQPRTAPHRTALMTSYMVKVYDKQHNSIENLDQKLRHDSMLRRLIYMLG